MGRTTNRRWRKDRETLLRALRDFEMLRLTEPAQSGELDLGLDSTDQRIASIKRRIADLEAKLPQEY